MYQSQQDLLKQGIEWMKIKECELVKLYIDTVRANPNNFFARLESTEQTQFAITNIKGIIARLEGTQISLERTEQNLFAFFEKGATLADLNEILDGFGEAFVKRVERDFADNPALARILVERIAYMKQAYSTVTSLAMVKFQSKKLN